MATKKYSIGELAEMTGASIVGNPAHLIDGVDSLENAESEDASFLGNARYREQMKSSKAGVICIGPSIELPADKNFLIHDSPSQIFQIIVEAFLKDKQIESGFSGIHPTAVIHPQAIVEPGVVVGPYVVIDRYARIGARTHLFAH